MDKQLQHRLVPQQEAGIHTDKLHAVNLQTVEDAEELFVLAMDSLLEVNKWHEYCPELKAEFSLHDSHDHSLHRHAHKGDQIFRDGTQWVNIEAIIYDDYPDEDRESIAMLLKPVDSNEASSTLVLERWGKHLNTSYHGRNEKSIQSDSWLGFTEEAWQDMLCALLRYEEV